MEEERSEKRIQDIWSIIKASFFGILISLGIFLESVNLYVLLLVAPFPYIKLIKERGHQPGLSAILITVFVNYIIFGFYPAIIALISFGLFGIILGGAFHEKLSPKKTLGVSIGATIFSGMIFLYLSFQTGAIDVIRQLFEQSGLVQEMVKSQSLDPALMENFLDLIVSIMPAMIISFSIWVGIIMYYLSVGYLQRSDPELELIAPISTWKFPRWLGFGTVLLYLLGLILPGELLTLNLLLIGMGIMLLVGVSFLASLGDRLGVIPLTRNILITILVIFLSPGVMIVGLADNLLGLRKYI